MVFKLLKVVRKHKIDVIHAHNYEGALVGGFVGKLTGVPVIYNAINTMIGELASFNFIRPRALAIGLANRVVPEGQAREAAEQLAAELAALPQQCMRSDRLSALHQWGISEPDALDYEFASISRVAAEAMEGAGRFAGGAGRHGAAAV